MAGKRKIINDPLHGFITFPTELIYQIIDHPGFQRLRRIRQVGLLSYVYPGACHTRFHHALGVAYLAKRTVGVLREKGVEISDEENEAVIIAALLHDVGHGPFSHVLEGVLVNCAHEELSLRIMNQMNVDLDGRLTLAKAIFENSYHRKFLHQIISSQLDVDRLDYLSRDSFYTGVVEGLVGADRLLTMMDVVDDQLVLEEKAIHSIENFLFARQFMYSQVYMHKTVLILDDMLRIFLNRYKDCYLNNQVTRTNQLLKLYQIAESGDDKEVTEQFMFLDDYDIFSCLKEEMFAKDRILSYISGSILNRMLFKIKYVKNAELSDEAARIRIKTREKLNLTKQESFFLVNHRSISNPVYTFADEIKVLTKKGEIKPISLLPIRQNLSFTEEVHYITYPVYI